MKFNVIQIIIVLLVIVIPTVFRLINKIRQAQEAGQPPRQPGQGANLPAQRAPGKPVHDEIEDFLSRVVESRKAKPASGSGQRSRRRERPAATQQPVEAQVIEARPVGGSVASAVKQHLDTSQIGRSAAHMGEGVVQADERFDKRIQQAFEHRLGSLERTADIQPQPATEADVSAAAASLVPGSFAAPGALMAMFSSPEAVRSAVLMHEILQRPVERWG